jgi:histidyl-tRNA synthetase
MADRSTLIEARLPRGFEDRAAADIAAVDKMIATIKSVYERYGFDPLETPFLEYTETLGKFLPDTDRPNAGVFSLQDDDEQWMSLRYDLTAPLARYFAQNFDKLPKPFRSYRAGYVFRNEKPGPGRFRQFMQFDADTVGAAGPEADAEMCMMMADTMDALGLAGKYRVKFNNRKIWDGALDTLGVDPEKRLIVLRAIDKYDRLGMDGVKALLGKGRRDESGDFTDGAQLTVESISLVTLLLAAPDIGRLIGDDTDSTSLGLMDASALRQNGIYAQGVAELQAIADQCVVAGYRTDRIAFDPSVVRGLEYYTGPVSRFRADAVPATGFSIGVSRLANALRLTGNLTAADSAGPVVVLVLDRDPTAIADYQKMTSELRIAGIRAEMYLGSSGMNAQMKYADRRNAAAAVIVGSNERAAGQVTIKDLAAGAEAAKAIKDNAEYKAAKVGQWTAARTDLLAELSKIPSVAAMLKARA